LSAGDVLTVLLPARMLLMKFWWMHRKKRALHLSAFRLIGPQCLSNRACRHPLRLTPSNAIHHASCTVLIDLWHRTPSRH